MLGLPEQVKVWFCEKSNVLSEIYSNVLAPSAFLYTGGSHSQRLELQLPELARSRHLRSPISWQKVDLAFSKFQFVIFGSGLISSRISVVNHIHSKLDGSTKVQASNQHATWDYSVNLNSNHAVSVLQKKRCPSRATTPERTCTTFNLQKCITFLPKKPVKHARHITF